MTSVGRRVRAHLTPLFSWFLSLALVAPALMGTGCGGAPPAPPAEATPEAAPYPFTVYQIRAGCASGRSIDFRMEKAGEQPKTERWLFADADAESVKITTTDFDATGKPLGEPTTESAKWTELHEHAHFPFAATVITSEPITLPVGTFDATRYVVTKGDEVKTYWFARSLPGPPVKVEIAKGGKTVLTMTMEANLAKAR